MSPFSYPKVRHIRTLTPGPYKRYQSYKDALRQEFGNKCVYCCAPDLGLKHTYAVEHYRPKKQFPLFACDYKNLYYACPACNTHKGPFWPSRSQRLNGEFIPNPCDHVMFSHLRYSAGQVYAQSPTGIFASQVLDLNSPGAVAHRQAIEAAINGLESQLSDAKKLMAWLSLQLASGNISQQNHDAEMTRLTTLASGLEANIKHFGG
ncbi:HNH endonuclease [Burkholderia cepacia]|uniref:HNH endonuclease n=1 Tax=Burkholderia cepacia TaxID=292 RepID=UPI001CF198E3|nr:hypothetical protein [Burkholderia cepacia]MCA7941560.1 hypothetical protein [Burkholderia cepacia]